VQGRVSAWVWHVIATNERVLQRNTESVVFTRARWGTRQKYLFTLPPRSTVNYLSAKFRGAKILYSIFIHSCINELNHAITRDFVCCVEILSECCIWWLAFILHTWELPAWILEQWLTTDWGFCSFLNPTRQMQGYCKICQDYFHSFPFIFIIHSHPVIWYYKIHENLQINQEHWFEHRQMNSPYHQIIAKHVHFSSISQSRLDNMIESYRFLMNWIISYNQLV